MRPFKTDAIFQAMIESLELSGKSRAEITSRSGLSRQSVWRYAEGLAQAPTLDSYRKLEKLVTRSGVPLVAQTVADRPTYAALFAEFDRRGILSREISERTGIARGSVSRLRRIEPPTNPRVTLACSDYGVRCER